MKRVLITGATGFIGSHLTTYLCNLGFEVHVLLRSKKNLTSNLRDRSEIKKHIISIDYADIDMVLARVKPDVVIHLASSFVAEHVQSDIDNMIEGNIKYGTYLLEAMHNNKIRKFINTGSSWEHFNNSHYSPVNLYASTKYAFQKILDYYVERGSIDAVTLKLFDTYGPGDKRKKLVHQLIEAAKSNSPLEISPGEQKLNVVHVNDVCNAYFQTIKLLERCEGIHYMFGVASKEALSLKEFVLIFEKVIGKKLNIKWGARSYREREMMVPWTSYEKVPCWEEKISLFEGLSQLVNNTEIV